MQNYKNNKLNKQTKIQFSTTPSISHNFHLAAYHLLLHSICDEYICVYIYVTMWTTSNHNSYYTPFINAQPIPCKIPLKRFVPFAFVCQKSFHLPFKLISCILCFHFYFPHLSMFNVQCSRECKQCERVF